MKERKHVLVGASTPLAPSTKCQPIIELDHRATTPLEGPGLRTHIHQEFAPDYVCWILAVFLLVCQQQYVKNNGMSNGGEVYQDTGNKMINFVYQSPWEKWQPIRPLIQCIMRMWLFHQSVRYRLVYRFIYHLVITGPSFPFQLPLAWLRSNIWKTWNIHRTVGWIMFF